MARRWLLVLLTISGVTVAAVADRGRFLVVREGVPQALLFDEGQQAIISWEGEEETLVLSTNLRARVDAVAVEFLPLPS